MKELGYAACFLGAALLATAIVDAMDAEEIKKKEQKRMREQKKIEPLFVPVQVWDEGTQSWINQ